MSVGDKALGSSYNSGCFLTVTWTSVQIVGTGSAVAVSGSFDTKSPIASYPNWAVQVQNLWNEYRVCSLKFTVKPVANLAIADLYFSPAYLAQYAGTTPSTTATAISQVPWHKLKVMTDRPFSISWKPRDDPDQFQFLSTTTGIVWGGIVYNMSSTTTATQNVVWAVFEYRAVLQLRNRRF